MRTRSRHDLEDSRYDGYLKTIKCFAIGGIYNEESNVDVRHPMNNTMDELIPKTVRPLNVAEHDDHHSNNVS